ncbi:hypothetical protein GJAV_G00100950 [Gymnothorax javanicus]|nr:hypothetical protein GJAV_G00100950 [Gymnothorax javanicus]
MHSSFSSATHEAVVSPMSHTDNFFVDYPEGSVDVPSTDSATANGNGNGRQRPVTMTHQTGDQLVTDIHHDMTVDPHGIDSLLHSTVLTGGVEAHSIIPQTDVLDRGMESVTSSHIQADITGLDDVAMTGGHTNTTDSVNLGGGHTETSVPVTGDTLNTMTQTDMMDMVTADPQGVHKGLSQTGITPLAQHAASAAEQYVTSGQGPEGTENVELEDSC